MPVDKDVFAFRLRQSDDFACSVKWNQNRLYDFRKSNPFATITGQSPTRRDQPRPGERALAQQLTMMIAC